MAFSNQKYNYTEQEMYDILTTPVNTEYLGKDETANDYEDGALIIQILEMEVFIDEAIEYFYNAYGTIEPDAIYEEFESYQSLYNHYLFLLASSILEEINANGSSIWFDYKFTV